MVKLKTKIMKKIVLLLLLLFCGNMYSQKKKKSPKAKTPTTNVVAKTDNLTAELIKGNFYVFRIDKAAKKDTLLLKTFSSSTVPTDCIIKKFTAKTLPLYCITWTENTSNDSNTKKELIASKNAQIWNPAAKMQLFTNTQTSTNIKEQVFLDKNKTASETQERNRNEGFNFTLLPDGDFTLKNKSSESKYSFNATTMQFETPKSAATVQTKPVKKKK